MKTSKRSASKKNIPKTTKAKNVDPVVHFEMPAADGKRVSKFYKTAFGWKMQSLGKEMGNYILATTAAEVDKNGGPKKKGIINGGFYTISEDKPAQYPSVVIAVDNLKKSMNKINKAGGKVIGEPMNIPGYGTYVSFYDTEGNLVSIIEPTMEMKKKAH
jgi:predicted enzyme related to lactoylglutathione lyase